MVSWRVRPPERGWPRLLPASGMRRAMPLDRPTIAHVARLARLPLSDEEAERLARELPAILAAFESLPVEPAPAPAAPREAPARADVVAPVAEDERARIVANFPRREGALARVPRGL